MSFRPRDERNSPLKELSDRNAGNTLATHAEEGIWDGSLVNVDTFPIELPVLHKGALKTEGRLLGKNGRCGK